MARNIGRIFFLSQPLACFYLYMPMNALLEFPSKLITRILNIFRERPTVAWILVGLLLLGVFVNGLRITKAHRPLFNEAQEKKVRMLLLTTPPGPEREMVERVLKLNRLSYKSDFHDYYQASRSMAAGKELYGVGGLEKLREKYTLADVQKNPALILTVMSEGKLEGFGKYLYPPFFAWLLRSLSFLEYPSAALFFQFVSLAALTAFLWIFFVYGARSMLGAEGEIQTGAPDSKEKRNSLVVPLVSGLILFSYYFQENSGNGNIGFLLILLCGGGLIFAWDERPWLSILGGLLLGIAASIKVTPGFLGLTLIAGRRYYAMAGMGLGGLLGLFAPALSLGLARDLEYFRSWVEFLPANFDKFIFVRAWENNQSLPGALGKLYKMSISEGGLADKLGSVLLTRKPGPGYYTLVQVAKIGNYSLYALAALTSVFLFFRGKDTRGRGAFLTSPTLLRMTMLVMLVSLVASGVSWYHAYCVLFVPWLLRLHQHFNLDRPLELYERIMLGIFGFYGTFYLALSGSLQAKLSNYSVFAWLAIAQIFVLAWKLVVAGEGAERK